MPNGTWLRDVRAVERDKGVDYTTLACHASVLTPYVRQQLAHAAQKIEQLYTALPSALVPDEKQRVHWEEGRDAYVAHICEVVQHLGVALASVGCTDSEAEKYFARKEDATSEKSVTDSDDTDDDVEDSDSGGGETVVMALHAVGAARIPQSES